jgi:hypothetical protein
MNCHQFQEYRIEIARNLPLEGRLKVEALDHAQRCPRCQRLLAAERSLLAALAEVQRKSDATDAPLRLESGMLELFRKNTPVPIIMGNSSLTDFSKSGWRRRPWILAAAALFILAISLLGLRISPSLLRGKIGSVSTAKKMATTERSSKQSIEQAMMAQIPDISQQARDASLPLKKGIPAKRPGYGFVSERETTSPKLIEESKTKQTVEPVTDFIEVSPLEEAYPQEIRQVVRVRLPRGSLARFGFPVNVERIHESVQADLLLSQEGWVKAIRFVK